ncbi:hypothetical protein RRG08_016231 [Elysia crispata]|uniref:Uncharacterized protein n=1 Tax=Elysia crispata TaxID=231223 RepID=A0AAE1DKV7_9GAST|nr:hypothetical protein RRG08_016231 [Elysia crispata]
MSMRRCSKGGHLGYDHWAYSPYIQHISPASFRDSPDQERGEKEDLLVSLFDIARPHSGTVQTKKEEKKRIFPSRVGDRDQLTSLARVPDTVTASVLGFVLQQLTDWLSPSA